MRAFRILYEISELENPVLLQESDSIDIEYKLQCKYCKNHVRNTSTSLSSHKNKRCLVIGNRHGDNTGRNLTLDSVFIPLDDNLKNLPCHRNNKPIHTTKEYNYIYVLIDNIDNKHILNKENLYKVGKTTREMHKRLLDYPIGSRLLLCLDVQDCHKTEKILLDVLRQKYINRLDVGTEYFEADIKELLNDVCSVCSNE